MGLVAYHLEEYTPTRHIKISNSESHVGLEKQTCFLHEVTGGHVCYCFIACQRTLEELTRMRKCLLTRTRSSMKSCLHLSLIYVFPTPTAQRRLTLVHLNPFLKNLRRRRWETDFWPNLNGVTVRLTDGGLRKPEHSEDDQFWHPLPLQTRSQVDNCSMLPNKMDIIACF